MKKQIPIGLPNTTALPILIFLSLLLMLTEASVRQSLRFDVLPEADAFTTPGASNETSDQNFGAAGALSVSSPGSSKGEHQTVLRFNLTAAHAAFNEAFGMGQWQIEGAELKLTLAQARNPIFNPNTAGHYIISWLPEDSWIEGAGRPSMPVGDGITWTRLTEILTDSNTDELLGEFDYDGSSEGTLNPSLTLATAFRFDLENESLVSLRVFATDSRASLVFNSRNVGNESLRPVLAITAIPTPIVSAKAPKLFISVKSMSSVLLYWETEVGNSYQLLSTEVLNASEWTNQGSPIVAREDRHEVDLPSNTRSRFFRIVLVEP